MKKIAIALLLLGTLTAVSTTDANAFVCARGVVRAGCVGPNGAVGVRRGITRMGYRGGAVVHRGVVVRRGAFRR